MCLNEYIENENSHYATLQTLDIDSYMGHNNYVIVSVQEILEYHDSLLVRGRWSILLWKGMKPK